MRIRHDRVWWADWDVRCSLCRDSAPHVYSQHQAHIKTFEAGLWLCRCGRVHVAEELMCSHCHTTARNGNLLTKQVENKLYKDVCKRLEKGDP